MQARGRPITLSDDTLLDIARDVFLERGLEATTSHIAKRARISESVIFHRFKTKEALFTAVFERQFVVPSAIVKLGFCAGSGTVAGNLFDAAMGLVEFLQRVMPFLMMAFVSPSKLKGVLKHAREPHPMRREMIALLARYFEAEARAGRLRAGLEGAMLARTFLGAVTELVISQQMERTSPPLDARAFVRGLIDIVLHGVKSRSTLPRGRQRAIPKKRS